MYNGANSLTAFYCVKVVLISASIVMLVFGAAKNPLRYASLEPLLPTASAQPSSSNSPYGSGNSTSKDIDFAANVEMVKAHLAQATQSKQSGDTDMAEEQISEALTERYSAIVGPRVQSINPALDGALKSSLDNLDNSAGSMSLTDFTAAVQNTFGQLDKASSEVLARTEIADARFNASVVVAIVSKASGEYTEAVTVAGKIDKPLEYQIAQAFTGRAESLFNSTLFAANQTGKENVSLLFSKLKSDMTSIRASASIQSAADSVTAAIAKLSGISIENLGTGFASYVINTQTLLKQALIEYRNGNFTGADNLATSAYLDNFENVEPELIKRGYGDLESQTEQMMRITLRQSISEKAPADQVANVINSINENLDRIVTVVPEFPIPNMVAIAPVMALGVLLVMRFKRTSTNSDRQP